ncbi:MAG: hypothetical protein LBT32_05780 [Peptococcaceae bacterium]|jgi:hypothetical protein|nr:hypothetical protein [Peptococcaceae bacterium]
MKKLFDLLTATDKALALITILFIIRAFFTPLNAIDYVCVAIVVCWLIILALRYFNPEFNEKYLRKMGGKRR